MLLAYVRSILRAHARRFPMQHDRYETLLPNPAARPSPRRNRVLIALEAAVLAIALAACGSENTRQGTDQAIPAPKVVEQNQTMSAPDTVRVPDLNDPAVRRQFVCSFADGYFTEPQPPQANSTSDCR